MNRLWTWLLRLHSGTCKAELGVLLRQNKQLHKEIVDLHGQVKEQHAIYEYKLFELEGEVAKAQKQETQAKERTKRGSKNARSPRRTIS